MNPSSTTSKLGRPVSRAALMLLAILAAATPITLFGQAATPKPQSQPSADAVPLNIVITQVKAALDQYQKSLGTGGDALPKLQSAEFDFKATTEVTVGGKISFLIFTIGGSRTTNDVNDVTYTYSVPSEPKSGVNLLSVKIVPSLKDELYKTIRQAAEAAKNEATLGELKFSKLTVVIQYGIKVDMSGGIAIPVYTLVVGVTGDANKNEVQSVKLVFGK